MNVKDFRNIMNNGFQADYKGNDSQVRCFKCGEYSELLKINKKWKMKCKNNHKYNLAEWLVLHINMRDGVAKAFLNDEYNFIKQ